ncbi:heavy metal-binding domain-containing protein [Tropicibacter sp. Alg240-R139]|uniref:heavy metal-binding domain-containing protein n=1 Tax=Tropicibacter sp. Alg240-R139 TaxID=2305991 RepID=UPI00279587E5|nr:heavy metal-binding domain-containing protein [Tropicibacter sp. Alg240-R139]
MRNIVGGRTGNIQNALKDMREKALTELRVEAASLGGGAVVGVGLDYSEIGATGSTMLMLVVSGTAVRLAADL